MRTVEEYMKLPYKMEKVEDLHEGGYVVSFPELPGCLTIAQTIEEAIIFGKNSIVDSNLWDTMRDHGPEYAVDRVYGFYSRYE